MTPMTLAEPHLRRWTKAEYHKAAELGWFQSQRVELIDGEVLEMAPQKDEHAAAVTLVDYALRPIFGNGYVIRIQAPMNAGQETEPEPDILVTRGTPRSIDRHPSTAILVVEVAGVSLDFDRTRKSSLYASCDVPEYWIINLIEKQLEIRRAPRSGTGEFGADYSETRFYRSRDSVATLAKPRSKIKVADLLP